MSKSTAPAVSFDSLVAAQVAAIAPKVEKVKAKRVKADAPRRGRPPVFKGGLVKRVQQALLRNGNATHARADLAARGVPISMPTLLKIAAQTDGVELRRGRPKAA
jgi:hypothetical protein